MLKELGLSEFKSFESERLDISPLVLLVGANAAGKSNLLDALKLLNGIAHGWTVSDSADGRVEGGTRVWEGVRAGFRGLFRNGDDRFKLETHWLVSGDGCRHELEVDRHGIVRESLGNIFIAERDDSRTQDRLKVTWTAGSYVPGEEWQSEWLSPLTRRRCEWAESLRGEMASIRFLELRPESMREFVDPPPSGMLNLASDGSNLSGVLWNWCQDATRKEELLDWLEEFCQPEIDDVEFEQTSDNRVMLKIVERGGARTLARAMSDGSLTYLGLLVAIRTLGRHETLVVEDIDNGLHPERLRLLVDAIRTSLDPTLWGDDDELPAVIATTHSPALLDRVFHWPEAAIHILKRAEPNWSTVIHDVREIVDLEQARDFGGLGFLFGTGWVEQNL